MNREHTGVASDSRESTLVMKESGYPWLVWSRVIWRGVCRTKMLLSDCTAHTGCSGRQPSRGEGASGHGNTGATSRSASGDVGTESSIKGRAGDGVFLVWSSRAWGEPMLPGGHFVSVSAAGMVGCCPGWPASGSMAWFQSGNEGWSGREGQPPGPVVTVGLLTGVGGGECGERAAPVTRNQLVWVSPVGHAHDCGWSPSVQAFPPLGSLPPVFSPG